MSELIVQLHNGSEIALRFRGLVDLRLLCQVEGEGLHDAPGWLPRSAEISVKALERFLAALATEARHPVEGFLWGSHDRGIDYCIDFSREDASGSGARVLTFSIGGSQAGGGEYYVWGCLGRDDAVRLRSFLYAVALQQEKVRQGLVPAFGL